MAIPGTKPRRGAGKHAQRAQRRRSPAWIALITGLALAAGGGTYALWSVSVPLGAGQVKTGTMHMTETTSSWYDMTAARAGYVGVGEPIIVQLWGVDLQLPTPGFEIDDISTYEGSPGDGLMNITTTHVTLDGNNLLAAVKLTNRPWGDSVHPTITVCYGPPLELNEMPQCLNNVVPDQNGVLLVLAASKAAGHYPFDPNIIQLTETEIDLAVVIDLQVPDEKDDVDYSDQVIIDFTDTQLRLEQYRVAPPKPEETVTNQP